MPEPPKQRIVVEARAIKAGEDPQITIFHVSIDDGKRGWTDTLGSRELLQAFLKGITATLAFTGLAGILIWNLPETFGEPSGLRWTLVRGELAVHEELRSDGSVIRMD